MLFERATEDGRYECAGSAIAVCPVRDEVEPIETTSGAAAARSALFGSRCVAVAARARYGNSACTRTRTIRRSCHSRTPIVAVAGQGRGRTRLLNHKRTSDCSAIFRPRPRARTASTAHVCFRRIFLCKTRPRTAYITRSRAPTDLHIARHFERTLPSQWVTKTPSTSPSSLSRPSVMRVRSAHHRLAPLVTLTVIRNGGEHEGRRLG